MKSDLRFEALVTVDELKSFLGLVKDHLIESNYNDFLKIPKNTYKAFVVVRDIRDVMISQYFSITYSHSIINESHAKGRIKLQKMNFDESFMYFLTKVYPIGDIKFSYKRFLESWMVSNDEDIYITKYELLTQDFSYLEWIKIFKLLEIKLTDIEIQQLLEK